MSGEPASTEAGGLHDVELVLAADLQIKEVEAERQRLLESLQGASRIQVDSSRVAAVDTAGIQLLLAFQIEAAKRGIPVEWRAPAPALLQALTLLGLAGAVLGQARS